MDRSNPEQGSSNLVNYTSSENSQDEESRFGSDSSDSPGPSGTAGSNQDQDQRGEISKDSLDSSFTDDFSDDESICRSPAKSPLKRSRLAAGLTRKKRLEPDSEEGSGADGETESRLPTDQDFQFTEPKFRKKKFIFHHFLRNESGGCVPDQTKVSNMFKLKI